MQIKMPGFRSSNFLDFADEEQLAELLLGVFPVTDPIYSGINLE